MRRYLGEDVTRPSSILKIVSGLQNAHHGPSSCLRRKGRTAATIIQAVGCPMGCNFCTTSAFFGGKGKFVNFYETGDELYKVMCHSAESALEHQTFFMMDENFLLSPQARYATARTHEGRQQGVGDGSIRLRECHSPIQGRRTRRTGRLLDLDGP